MPQKLKKVITVPNLQNQNINHIPLTGDFHKAFGKPQDRGVWFVWGSSGSGKSSFLMQLAKEFSKEHKTLYNLLEEETDDAEYIERTQLFQMSDVADKFYTQAYDIDELKTYMSRRKSPKVYFIDSLRYLTRDFNEYLELKQLANDKNKILICSGFAKGQDPRSEFEYKVMHDAKMKIFVSGYAAYCKGRTIGPNGGLFIIYEDGYNQLRGEGAANEFNN